MKTLKLKVEELLYAFPSWISVSSMIQQVKKITLCFFSEVVKTQVNVGAQLYWFSIVCVMYLFSEIPKCLSK